MLIVHMNKVKVTVLRAEKKYQNTRAIAKLYFPR